MISRGRELREARKRRFEGSFGILSRRRENVVSVESNWKCWSAFLARNRWIAAVDGSSNSCFMNPAEGRWLGTDITGGTKQSGRELLNYENHAWVTPFYIKSIDSYSDVERYRFE